jgi:hypothetical protein
MSDFHAKMAQNLCPASDRCKQGPRLDAHREWGDHFVCGDGEKMEPDMRAELMSLFRERTGAGAGAGEALRWIEEMGTSGRYVLDVWSDNLR